MTAPSNKKPNIALRWCPSCKGRFDIECQHWCAELRPDADGRWHYTGAMVMRWDGRIAPAVEPEQPHLRDLLPKYGEKYPPVEPEQPTLPDNWVPLSVREARRKAALEDTTTNNAAVIAHLEAAAQRYHEAGYAERAIACSVMATEIKAGAHHA